MLGCVWHSDLYELTTFMMIHVELQHYHHDDTQGYSLDPDIGLVNHTIWDRG